MKPGVLDILILAVTVLAVGFVYEFFAPPVLGAQTAQLLAPVFMALVAALVRGLEFFSQAKQAVLASEPQPVRVERK